MNRENFLEKIRCENVVYTEKEIKNIIKNLIDSNTTENVTRGDHELIIAIEELAELAQALTKYLRGKGDIVNLIEEYADVIIILKIIKEVLPEIKSELIEKAVYIKVQRIEEELKKNKKML